jgi:NurA-like 5'-3' nuclease
MSESRAARQINNQFFREMEEVRRAIVRLEHSRRNFDQDLLKLLRKVLDVTEILGMAVSEIISGDK